MLNLKTQVIEPTTSAPRVKLIIMKRGYTLIELLVYLGIFTIIIGVISTLVIQTLNYNLQSTADSALAQTTRNLFFDFSQTIRRSTNVSSPALGFSANRLELNNGQVIYQLNAAQRLEKTESGETALLTPTNIRVNSLNFEHLGNPGDRSTIRLTLSLEASSAALNPVQSQTLQTTVSLR